MSFSRPFSASLRAVHPPEVGDSAREPDLRKALEELRAENEHLRLALARQLTRSPGAEAEANFGGLPIEFDFGNSGGEHTTSKVEYDGLLAALGKVFPIGVFRTDSAGLLTHVDNGLQRIMGLPRSGFANFGWLKAVHPDDRAMVQQRWAEAVLRDESQSLEFRLQRADGAVANLLVRNTPTHDPAGLLTGQIGFVQDISELRALEADAKLKEELNRQIIANSPDCTKVLDLQGRVLQMTAQGCQLVEVDDFEAVRHSDWTAWWPDEGTSQARTALQTAARGEMTRFVAYGPTFKGTPKWWDTAITPIRNADGQTVMLLVVSRDISERHRQQEEIRSLNEGLEARVQQRTQELALANQRIRETLDDAQSLYNQAPCGYHSVDGEGLFVRINQTELDWLGYQREEVLGRLRFRDMVMADQVETVKQRLSKLKQGEALDPIEVRLRRRGGGILFALLSSTAVHDAQGRFLHTNNTLVDITARHSAEAALSAQRSFLQTITNSVPVQLAFFDSGLICRFANASYGRWLNQDPQRLIGLHLSQIARPENYASALPHLKAALGGEVQRFEGERAFPGGPPFYASIEYTPYWQDGAVQGIFIQMLDISGRKASEDQVSRANRALESALAESQLLYNQAPCGYHSVDPSGVYVAINDTELAWLGYERDEVVGKMTYQDLMAPKNAELLKGRLQRLMSHGVVEPAEYEMRRRDGSVFPALVSSTAVRDANGNYLHSNTTVVDITDRVAAERALRTNERFVQAVTDHVPGLISYLDTELRFRFANAEHLRIYGMDPAKIMGQHLRNCVTAEMWQDVAPRLRAALAGEPQHFEAWRKTVDGQPMFISANYIPDVLEDQVKGIFVQIVDITERKRIEERVNELNAELEVRIRERSAELLESEQRFRLMVDNLREYSVFFLDAGGQITDWTDSAQRMDGFSPTEMLGQHYGVLFEIEHPGGGRDQAEKLLRLAASRGQHEVNTWHQRKDGSTYWAHSLLIALRDDDGELRGFAKINRDMSDTKRLDDLMRNINDELENRVAERTEQLLAANKDLESFSYSVSHDLRSPLRHISSFVSLLQEHLGEASDEVTSRYLGTIGNSARHMSQLIDGLLAFSRLGRAAVNITPVDFNLLVGTVVAQLAHDTEGRVVDWVVAPDLPVVQGDALLLREIWANLLGNAFKYSRPRERARIEVGWSVDPAVGYTFFVRDNGVGFDTKYSHKLFGVFQRLHRATEFEGTGIGLALARRIVERHGGSIWAESQPGEGSVFYFSLPFESFQSADFVRESGYGALT
ncbi:PAS domain S-box protein [Hydrogenophaga sp.]|uniref:PAS domain-containing sensor histidine kinase n=1 Tax=Hydrogenophaga sp. TaxID=1904254 RepID=UPI0025C54B42|nr:PAS domain S-box protein [Hydrogenophaga sp.]